MLQLVLRLMIVSYFNEVLSLTFRFRCRSSLLWVKSSACISQYHLNSNTLSILIGWQLLSFCVNIRNYCTQILSKSILQLTRHVRSKKCTDFSKRFVSVTSVLPCTSAHFRRHNIMFWKNWASQCNTPSIRSVLTTLLDIRYFLFISWYSVQYLAVFNRNNLFSFLG